MEEYVDISTVVSLLPIPLCEHKPGLQPSEYIIKAVKNPMRDCEVLWVSRARFPVYIDEHRPALVVPEPSDRVAAAICRDYKTTVSGFESEVAEPGLFWLKDQYKIGEILNGIDAKVTRALERARALQNEWFKRLVVQADDNWGKYRMRRMVSDIERLAAVALGMEKEWNIDTMVERALTVCKFCRSQVNNDAIVCPQCHGILNIERATKEFKTIDQLLQTVAPAK